MEFVSGRVINIVETQTLPLDGNAKPTKAWVQIVTPQPKLCYVQTIYSELTTEQMFVAPIRSRDNGILVIDPILPGNASETDKQKALSRIRAAELQSVYR